jgi:hypothetical protein
MPDKKKKEVIALSVLGALAAYLVYTNLLAGPSAPEHPAAAATASAATEGGPVTMVGAVPRKAPTKKGRSNSGEKSFNPPWLSNRVEERPNVSHIDPTLHVELFAKVQGVDPAGGKRNLFAFGAPPPPPAAELKGPEPKINLASVVVGPKQPPPPAPPPQPAEPAPLQIPLKYYGIVAYTRGGNKTACFMDGEEILTASEGDTLKRRYRVVRIGNTSVVMEDTESKRQGTLPIAPEAQG